jgi:hypothetical protein
VLPNGAKRHDALRRWDIQLSITPITIWATARQSPLPNIPTRSCLCTRAGNGGEVTTTLSIGSRVFCTGYKPGPILIRLRRRVIKSEYEAMGRISYINVQDWGGGGKIFAPVVARMARK